jgi:hypothetical protein
MIIAIQCTSASDGPQPRGAAGAGGSMGWDALRCSYGACLQVHRKRVLTFLRRNR